MRFSEFLSDRKLTEEAAAAELDKSIGAIRKWKSGDRTPRPQTIAEIERWSEGKVTFSDWCSPDEKAAA